MCATVFGGHVTEAAQSINQMAMALLKRLLLNRYWFLSFDKSIPYKSLDDLWNAFLYLCKLLW